MPYIENETLRAAVEYEVLLANIRRDILCYFAEHIGGLRPEGVSKYSPNLKILDDLIHTLNTHTPFEGTSAGALADSPPE